MTKAMVSMKRLVSIVEKKTAVRARDLYQSGIHPEALSRALQCGLLLKIGRGLYARKNFSDLFYYFFLDGLMALSALLMLLTGI